MPASTIPTELWNIKQASVVLGKDFRIVSGAIAGLGLTLTILPSRNGHYLDRDDIERLAESLGVVADFGRATA